MKLRKTDEFSSVCSFRKSFSRQFLVVHYKPNSEISTRIGFVVAKKIAKRAVDRNYMRRVLRELCRQELNTLYGVDCKSRLKMQIFQQLKMSMRICLLKSTKK